MTDAFIYEHLRTPRGKGKKDGSLHLASPAWLLRGLLQALQRRLHLDTALVDDLVLGCVTPVGEQGADIARTAARRAKRAGKSLACGHSSWPRGTDGKSRSSCATIASVAVASMCVLPAISHVRERGPSGEVILRSWRDSVSVSTVNTGTPRSLRTLATGGPASRAARGSGR